MTQQVIHAETPTTTLSFHRKVRGMTQQQVADAAGMTRSHYGLVEQGRSSLSPEKACRLAVVLGITLDEVYGVRASE